MCRYLSDFEKRKRQKFRIFVFKIDKESNGTPEVIEKCLKKRWVCCRGRGARD